MNKHLNEKEMYDTVLSVLQHNAAQAKYIAELSAVLERVFLESKPKTTELVPTSVPEDSGDTMTEEELARHFGESLPPIVEVKPISKMTVEEVGEWEKAQDNSNDIYKIAARVKNLARANGTASLTPVGEALCNTFVHVAKTIYDFAETVSDPTIRIKLIEVMRSQEGMPANFIAAHHAGVKPDEND